MQNEVIVEIMRSFETSLLVYFGVICFCGRSEALLKEIFSIPYKSSSGSSLKDKLNYYEIIEIDRKIEKRGVTSKTKSGYNRQERVSFRGFGRNFELYLTPKKGLVHSNFKCRVIAEDESDRQCTVNPEEHYEGHVHGSLNSVISLTYDDVGSMFGIVKVDGEVYVFEPAKMHLASVDPRAILAYRSSDLKMQHGTGSYGTFCSPPLSAFTNNTNKRRNNGGSKRAKRSNTGAVKNRCALRVVADHRFFKFIGNGSLAFSARYLINVIDRVNTLYTAINWGFNGDGEPLINMGFMIKEMIIHTSPTLNQPYHYNSNVNAKRNVQTVLDNFSRIQGSDKFCLVHLFTAQSFANGVLGLAYISSPELESAGGICSIQSFTSSGIVYYNTALSSAKTTHGGTVISREADIVTAHELGHNWGATHDDVSFECTPPYTFGGSYIMNTFSVSGYDVNNNKFSPCSRRMIGKVLSRKADICFEPEMSAFCGNGRVENGIDGSTEECDVSGLLGAVDKCCTSECRLKPGALCSPKNSPCCSNDCKFLSSSHLCLHENRLQCKLSSYCTGFSGECPEPGPIADGTLCIEDGECSNGHCLAFCERPSVNKKPCICHNEADACLRCCRSPNGTCEPYSRDAKFILKDGTRCIHGHCLRATCIKEVADVISHLWSIIENIDETNFWKFVGNNLVGIVLTVALLVWIPISILVHKIDKAQEVAAEMEKNSRIEVVPGDRSMYIFMNSSKNDELN